MLIAMTRRTRLTLLLLLSLTLPGLQVSQQPPVKRKKVLARCCFVSLADLRSADLR